MDAHGSQRNIRNSRNPEPVNVESAVRVATLRARLGLTLHDCAEYLGVPVTTLIKWENGTRTPGSAAQRLLDVLGMIEVLAPDLHSHFLPEEQRRGIPRRKLRMPEAPFRQH